MRLIAVLTIAVLLLALYAGLRAKSSPKDRPFLPLLIVAVIALGAGGWALFLWDTGPVLYGEDVGDPGKP